MTFGPYRLKDVYVSGDNLVLALEDKDGTVYRPKRKLRYSDTEAEQRKAEALKGSMVTTETYDPSKWPATEWWTSISAYTPPSQRRLHALRVGNFKAFAETQRIPLKPITLIFGPNSAGKSSFIHSLALAHEAQFGRDRRDLGRLDVHRTELGGSAIDLGGFRQYVHRGHLNKRVEWGAELNAAELSNDKRDPLSQLLEPVSVVSLSVSLGIELDDQDRPRLGAEPRVEAVELAADGVELLRMSRRAAADASEMRSTMLRLDRLAGDHAVFRQWLAALVEAQTTSVELREEDVDGFNDAVAQLLPQLVVRVESFFPSGVELPKAAGAETAGAATLIAVSRGQRRDDIAQAVRAFLPHALDVLVKGVTGALAAELQLLQYLGPLRSLPARHLAFAEHEDADWYASGAYAWDVVRRDSAVRSAVNAWLGSEKLKTRYQLEVRSLVDTRELVRPIVAAISPPEREPMDLITMVNLLDKSDEALRETAVWKAARTKAQRNRLIRLIEKWRPRFDEAAEQQQANLAFDRNLIFEALADFNSDTVEENSEDDMAEMQDDQDRAQEAQRIVDAIEQSGAANLHELLLIDLQKDTAVSHRDVGIGISQVLPVLVLAYASRGKLLAMEQPEIHLHPALQAELGDVFIEAAVGERGNTLILETHSEHLILRLMRRIREGKLRPEDVGVFFVEPLPQGSRFAELRLDEEGDFIDEWPGGFFEESFHEKFAGR